ncbi:putative leucine-rich repeat-containing protein DDB_G0290503 isoform X2 [Condylostylus longicornis]|nr:putative leucine-rich repeat-containing protein DDB_G0290503 isoform X2 [Condylostylus longicornis]XP_055385113.1 putative leucine-rich repeat-containing protein DDB_G0290503 isoform X2 [Condylostylus longicornis]
MDKFIQALDNFGNCIKRNIMYFNEILVMKPKELIESRQIERAWDCITSVKEVIDILYDATRKLEENYKLSPKYHEFYFPMEELRESDYFNKNVTDFTPKNIKDFYNIYSYVQSQFLLRVALTVCQYNKIPFIIEDIPEMQRLIQQHINEEDEHFVNLSLQLKAKQQFEISNIHKQQTSLSKSGPIAVLKESSMKLSSCIIAVAEECQKLDLSLQKVDEIKFTENSSEEKTNEGNCLLDIANSMRAIESSLELCCNDFHRLIIVYNKFLNINIESNESENSDLEKDIQQSEYDSNSGFKNYEFENEKKDDFFAYVQDCEGVNNEKLNEHSYNDFELINLDEKITKGKFKPVLKQLKLKIDPIKKDMLEKEKKVLESKGIDINKLIEINIDNLNDKDVLKTVNKDLEGESENNDSDGSADELENYIQRPKKDNYEDMRNFLAQKDAINIFQKAETLLQKHVPEDILE